jgi:lysophospholipase L1-like esterase
VLGDSVVFGWGVNAEDTFTRRLEPLLARRLGRPVRTINAGVCSYATVPELRFLKRHGERIDPDLVLLLYVENDVIENLMPPPRDDSLKGKSPPQAVGMLLGRSWLYRLSVHILGHLETYPPTPLDPESPGWKASMAAAGEIADWCKARDNPFAVVFWRYGPSALTDAQWSDLERVAAGKGFLLADMAPAFQGKDLRPLTNSVVDSHPNAAGHEVAAERLDALLAPLLPAN